MQLPESALAESVENGLDQIQESDPVKKLADALPAKKSGIGEKVLNGTKKTARISKAII